MSTPKRPKRPRDPVQLAHEVFLKAIGEKPKALDENKTPLDPAKKQAIERSRRGGMKGGRLRAASLTPERRREIAEKAAKARWAKPKDGGPNSEDEGDPST
jgi:hypothetical protein